MSWMTLVLGAMPEGATPQTHIAAGPWCFAGQEASFPDFETAFEFAPEPLLDRNLERRVARQAQALCADIMPRLAPAVCPGTENLPGVYCETLLLPWAIEVAKQVVERYERVKAMCRAYGDCQLVVPLLPDDCTFRFATEHLFTLHGVLGHSWNHWLFSRLVEVCAPRNWKLEYLPAIHENHVAETPTGLRETLRQISLRLPCPRLKGMSVRQALRFSLALLKPRLRPDRSYPLKSFGSEARGIDVPLPLDPLPLFLASVPTSIKELRHPASVRKTIWPMLRIASVAAYEDTAYRQRLALWRVRGHRLMFVQHGGNYGQVASVCDTELVEYSQHAFGTWGWSKHGNAAGHFQPVPYPQLTNIADAWQGKHSRRLLVVGTEMPLFPYRLDAHPTPLQIVEYRDDKQWFFEALGGALQARAFYRPYFPVPGTLRDAEWVQERFPKVRRSTGPLAPQMLQCRLLVCDHHGTTMIEAMVANVPTILYWSRDAWPLTPEADALLDVLARAGIWHASAEEAAAKVREVWSDPRAWWLSRAVQDARRAFCALQGLVTENDPNTLWLHTLGKL